MAGGQERVLRRRIRSVQSTRKITKAMELIAASQIVARPGAHRREPPVPGGHGAHRAAPGGAPIPGGGEKCSAPPSTPSGSGSWPSWVTAASPVRTTRASLRATERLVSTSTKRTAPT
jgi:hypothetical protein